MNNIFNSGNNWYLASTSTGWTGQTWLTNSLEHLYKVIDMRDNYFNYQKCVSGVTYTYCNSLYNIYNMDISTSESINYKQNLYNEFHTIDTFMSNFKHVDICTTEEIDFNKKYTKLDNTLLKSNMRILLVNQGDKRLNGVYKMSSTGNMIIEDDLSTIDKSFRYSVFVKNGIVNKDKQFFLSNSGDTYPTTYQEKEFMEKRSYIIKNIFYYNLFQTGVTSDCVPKLLFTDYEIARRSLGVNAELYDSIEDSSVTQIEYDLGLMDPITIDTTVVDTIGDTISDIDYDSGYTIIRNAALYSHVGSYVQFTIENSSLPLGTHFLRYFTYLYQLKDINGVDNTGAVGIDQIPTTILTEITTKYNDCTYTVTIGSSDMVYYIDNMTPFSRFMYYSGGTDEIIPKNDENFYYIDFCDLSIDGTNFSTDNMYIKYKLFDHLNTIDDVTFTSTFEIKEPPPSDIIPTFTGLTSGTTLIQVDTTDTDYFKKNTFVYVNGDPNYITLVRDIIDGECIFIESGNTWSISSVNELNVNYELEYVSNILYYVYKNIEKDWYKKRSDNERKMITQSYGEILSLNDDIISKTTGIILYRNGNIELRLFNTESYYNNGFDEDSNTMDINMTYKPVDILMVGFDKKTTLPIPVFNENIESYEIVD